MNSCPLCLQTASFSDLATHNDAGVSYTLHECPLCGVQFWTPFKNPGADWYEHDIRYAGANEIPPLDPNWNHKRTVSYFGERTGRVLDIGCGTGNFLSWAAQNGWETYGIDFDRNAVNAARQVFDLDNIEVGGIHEFYAKNTFRFDLITFFDVFEHIDDHNEFIAEVKGMLQHGGHIALSMPFRKASHWLQKNDLPPRHLTRWDKQSLSDFLFRSGFEVVYMKTVPVSIPMMAIKLRLRYGKYVSFNLVGKLRATFGRKKEVVRIKKEKDVAFLKESPVVSGAHILAKIKDLAVFGIPAFFVWLYLGPTRRSTGLFAIARLKGGEKL